MQRTPQGPAPASHSSRTLTLSDAPPSASSDPQPALANPLPTLRLRGRADPGARGVTWSDNTVDNEGLGRKKSKICCIYHKPKPFDESSDESASSSDDSDAASDGSRDSRDGRATSSSAAPRRRHRHRRHHHHHGDGDGEDGEACGHAHGEQGGARRVPPAATTTTTTHDEAPRPVPNAYERAPGGAGAAGGGSGKGKGKAT